MVVEQHPGIDYVKRPALSKLGRGVYQAGSLRIDAQTTRDMRMRIISGVLEAIRPNVFLVDHEPAGAMDELLPVLDMLRCQPDVRTVLGLRDILDAPERTCALWADQGIDRLIAKAYDHVLVYGDESFFPSIAAYGLHMLKPGAVTDCGVVTTVTPRDRPTRKTRPARVLVSGGGGRDAYPLIDAALRALELLPARKRPKMTVVTGPLMDAELRSAAMRQGHAVGATVLEHVSDMPAMMAQNDLFLTMTGYNSINEALAIGCPIITVPRLGPSAEQRLRAEALELAGLAHYLRREELGPDSIARLLRRPPPSGHGVRLNTAGVRIAATRLAAMCADHTTGQERAHA